MKTISESMKTLLRRFTRVDSEARYLALLAAQLGASVIYEQRMSIYRDYSAAHERLTRLVGLHRMNDDLIPTLITPPSHQQEIL